MRQRWRSQCLSLGCSNSPDQRTPNCEAVNFDPGIWSSIPREDFYTGVILLTPSSFVWYGRILLVGLLLFVFWKSSLKGEQGPDSEYWGLDRSLSPTFCSQLPLRLLWPFCLQKLTYTHPRARFGLPPGSGKHWRQYITVNGPEISSSDGLLLTHDPADQRATHPCLLGENLSWRNQWCWLI